MGELLRVKAPFPRFAGTSPRGGRSGSALNKIFPLWGKSGRRPGRGLRRPSPPPSVQVNTWSS
jgi:hypothetical protein